MSRAVWLIVVGLEIIKLIKCERYPDLLTSKELEDSFGPKSFNREHPYRRKTTAIPQVHRDDIEQEVPLNLELYPQPRPRLPGQEKLFIPGTGMYSFGPGRQGGSTIPPEERIFPEYVWPPPDSSSHDMNELAKRLTLTNKWPEFLMLTSIEAKKHKPGEVMKNWELDVERWAGYSRQLLVRDKYAKEKALRASKALARMRTTVTTTEPIGPESGMEMYWGDALLNPPKASAPVTPKPKLVITPTPFYTYNRPPGLRRSMPGLGEPGYPVDEDLTYAGEENPRKSGAMPGFSGNREGGGYIGDKPALRGGAPVYDDYASDYPEGRSPNNYKIPGAEENRALQRQHPESLRMGPGGGGPNGNSQSPVNYNEPRDSSGHEDPLADLPGYGADQGGSGPGGPPGAPGYGGPRGPPGYGGPRGPPGYGGPPGPPGYGGPPGPPGYGTPNVRPGYGENTGATNPGYPHGPPGYSLPPVSSGYGNAPGPPGYGQNTGATKPGEPPGPPGYGQNTGPTKPGEPPGSPGYGIPPGSSGYSLPIPPDYGGGGPPGPPGSGGPPGPPKYGIPPGSSGYSPPVGPDSFPTPPDYGGGVPPGPPGRGGPPSPPGYGGDARALRSGGSSGPERIPIPPDYGGPPGPHGRGGPSGPPGRGRPPGPPRDGRPSGGQLSYDPARMGPGGESPDYESESSLMKRAKIMIQRGSEMGGLGVGSSSEDNTKKLEKMFDQKTKEYTAQIQAIKKNKNIWD